MLPMRIPLPMAVILHPAPRRAYTPFPQLRAWRCTPSAVSPSKPWRSCRTLDTFGYMTIFHLRRAYHDSLSNMRGWLLDTSLSDRLTVLDRLSIIDAWQQEMVEFFTRNGYCFACNRRVSRCTCPHEQH